MKNTISIEKDMINIKRNVKRIIIPLNPKEGKPWMEPWKEESNIRNLH
jgi:hypothetical protein